MHNTTENDQQNDQPTEALRNIRTYLKLNEQERTALHNALLLYQRQHPLRAPSTQRSLWSFFTLPKFLRSWPAAGMAMLLLFTVSAGTAGAAERALPGEILYPIKVEVTEPLRGFLAVSVASQARWNATLVDRRLDEATALSAQGRLDKKTATILSQKIAKSVIQVENEANTLKEQDHSITAMSIQSSMTASLAAQAQVLARIEVTNQPSENQERVDEPLAIINIQARAAEAATASAKTSTIVESNNDKKLARLVMQQKKKAERKIAAARTLLENRRSLIDLQAGIDVENTIHAAAASLQTGQIALAANEYGKAYIQLQEAESSADQASAVIHTSQRLRKQLTQSEASKKKAKEKESDKNIPLQEDELPASKPSLPTGEKNPPLNDDSIIKKKTNTPPVSTGNTPPTTSDASKTRNNRNR